MGAKSEFVLIDEWPLFRGRAHRIDISVTSVMLGKTYQIEFWASWDPTQFSEGDKTLVGVGTAFETTGDLEPVHLDLDGFPLQTLVRLYARIEVLSSPAIYVSGDVKATFTRTQSLIEGVSCLTQCEGNTCQTACMAGTCQNLCENFAETQCSNTCEIGCQGLGCQSTCELTCQSSLEYYCSTSQETACSQGCEVTCQLAETVTCFSSCEESCVAGQEVGGAGEIDDGTTFGGVLFQFSSGPDTAKLFLIGQSASFPYDLYYKIADPDTPNKTIKDTAWTAFPFSLPSAAYAEMHPDGFQASDGSLWVTFSQGSSGSPSWKSGWITKSTDFGSTWETPVNVPDIGQESAVPTICEGAGGSLVWANVRQRKFGSQEDTWADVGELTILEGNITMTAAELAAESPQQLFHLPLLLRDIDQGLFGIGGLRLRYNPTTEKYLCFYQQGDIGQDTRGAAAVLLADSIADLDLAQPQIVLEGEFLSFKFLDVAIDPTDEYNITYVSVGRRRTSEVLGFLDLVMVVSRDGGYVWEDEVTLVQGTASDINTGTANRCRMPMVEVLSDGRTVVTHNSADDGFATAFDIWLNRGLRDSDLPDTVCSGSCETGYEHALDFSPTRDMISDVDGILARAGLQLTLDAAATPTPLGDLIFVGTRVGSPSVGGVLYVKTVPFNATPLGILGKPWVRAIDPGPDESPAGLPKIVQLSDGEVWVVQGFVDSAFSDVPKLYAAKSADLGVSWTAWSLVSTEVEGTSGQIIEDATGPVIAWTDSSGFMYYKRFSLGDSPASLDATPDTSIILDPDRKQPVPSDIVTDPDAGPPPAYTWSGFDMLYRPSPATYFLVYSVGDGGESNGQIFLLQAPDLDDLRFATPTLVAPDRVALGKGLLDSPDTDRTLLQNGELRVIELPGDILAVAYNSEHATVEGIIRAQSIYRLSYDLGLTWVSAVTPFEDVVSYRGFASTLLYTDRPQGILTSVGTSGGSSAMSEVNLFIQQSAAPLSCQSGCEAAFEAACASSCETAVESGLCASSCETGAEVL